MSQIATVRPTSVSGSPISTPRMIAFPINSL